MTRKLIAMVATAVLIGGQRTVIPPGGELPGLNEHDAGALLASGAAQDPAQEAAAAAQADQQAAAAQAAFEAERAAVQQAQASTEADTSKAPAKGGKAGGK